MSSEKPLRRLPLRQLLASSDKATRDLHEQVHTHFLARLSESRDLSRPVRRRTHYPTMQSLQNGLRRLREVADQLNTLTASVLEHLDAVREHAQREKAQRRS